MLKICQTTGGWRSGFGTLAKYSPRFYVALVSLILYGVFCFSIWQQQILAPNPFRLFFSSEPSTPRPYGGHLRSWDKVDKEIDEDCAKAGYNDLGKYIDDLNKKNPDFLELSASLCQKCAAEHGAESDECAHYKRYWLECKKAQNA